jgi:hypothetical protein
VSTRKPRITSHACRHDSCTSRAIAAVVAELRSLFVESRGLVAMPSMQSEAAVKARGDTRMVTAPKTFCEHSQMGVSNMVWIGEGVTCGCWPDSQSNAWRAPTFLANQGRLLSSFATTRPHSCPKICKPVFGLILRLSRKRRDGYTATHEAGRGRRSLEEWKRLR